MSGVGTSKEDKRRKRRSLPYEKKPQADKARRKKQIMKISKIAGKIAAGVISPLLGEGIIRVLRPVGKKNKKKYGTQGYGKARKP